MHTLENTLEFRFTTTNINVNLRIPNLQNLLIPAQIQPNVHQHFYYVSNNPAPVIAHSPAHVPPPIHVHAHHRQHDVRQPVVRPIRPPQLQQHILCLPKSKNVTPRPSIPISSISGSSSPSSISSHRPQSPIHTKQKIPSPPKQKTSHISPHDILSSPIIHNQPSSQSQSQQQKNNLKIPNIQNI